MATLSNLELFLGLCTRITIETYPGPYGQCNLTEKYKNPSCQSKYFYLHLAFPALSSQAIPRKENALKGVEALLSVSVSREGPVFSLDQVISPLGILGPAEGWVLLHPHWRGGKLVLETLLTCSGLQLNSEPTPEPPCITVPGADTVSFGV